MTESLHIVCPQCTAVNKLASTRLAENPKCGKCHRVLFSARPIELTSSNFQQHINRNDVPMLVDFWAPWCGPCKMMAPAFEQAAQRLEPRVRLAKVNTETEQAIGTQYGIRSIPTLILFEKGKELTRQAGAMGAADIAYWAQTHIKNL